MKLAIVTTHPIQYNAPLFVLLTKRAHLSIKVFYTWGEKVLEHKYDPGFNKVVNWDVPLLEGYDYEFLENTAEDAGSHHFNGIINPFLIDRINLYKPHALLVFGWAYKSHLKALRYFKNKIPVLFRGDSTLLDKSSLLKAIMRNLFLRWVYSHVDYALYVGTNNYAYYKRAGLPGSRLVYAPHAIDNVRFACMDSNCKQQASEFRRQLSIPENDFVFLFAGKLEEKKDPEIVLKAFLEAGLQNVAHIVIAGSGDLKAKIEENYNHVPSIHFLDFQNQSRMPSLYKMSNVFILPSKGPGETWGLAINEAMAAGRPVIASDMCGGAVDLIQRGINGFIFRAGNKSDLGKQMKVMVEQKHNLTSMEEASVRHISNFTFQRVAEAVETTVMSRK